MGNTNCVAGGGCPHRADIQVVNQTKYDLALDGEVGCQRECAHTGWQVQDGKIVEGCEPPPLIKAYDNARFSVSGREATAVAPKARIFVYWTHTFYGGHSTGLVTWRTWLDR